MRWENLGLGAISLKLSLRRKGGEGRRRELNSVECGFWKTLSTTTKVLLLPSGTPRNLAQPSIASLVMGHFGWMNVSAVDGEGVRRGIRIVQGLLYSAPNSLAFLRQPIALRHSVLGGSVIWFSWDQVIATRVPSLDKALLVPLLLINQIIFLLLHLRLLVQVIRIHHHLRSIYSLYH